MTSVRENFAYNIVYQILALILPLVTAPYLSRVLGAEQLGTYSYSYAVANYFVIFAMLGVNNYGNREIAMARGDNESVSKTFCGIWSLQAVLSVVAVAAYIGYSLFLSGSLAIALIWLPYVLSALFDVNWLFFGLERFRITVTRNFIIKLATFALTFVVVRGDCALVNYLILMSTSMFLSVLAIWPFVLKELRFVWVGWKSVFSHLKPNLVLFVPVIAVSFYTVLDKVMLGQLSGMYEAGIFENSLKVAQMPFAFITALGTVMMPRASHLYASGRQNEAIAYIGPSMWLAILLSFAFMFGIIAVSPEFCPVFFGPGFDGCVPVMSLIVIEMPFRAWANVIRTQWLIPSRKDRAYVASVIVGAVVNIVVNVFLISRFGALGAAFGTLAAEISVCLVQTAAVLNELPMRQWIVEAIPGLVIGLAMLAVVRASSHFLPAGFLGLILEVGLGALFFALVGATWILLSGNTHAKRLFGPVVSVIRSRMSAR